MKIEPEQAHQHQHRNPSNKERNWLLTCVSVGFPEMP